MYMMYSQCTWCTVNLHDVQSMECMMYSQCTWCTVNVHDVPSMYTMYCQCTWWTVNVHDAVNNYICWSLRRETPTWQTFLSNFVYLRNFDMRTDLTWVQIRIWRQIESLKQLVDFFAIIKIMRALRFGLIICTLQDIRPLRDQISWINSVWQHVCSEGGTNSTMNAKSWKRS
jgi:hypothetical protein